MACQELVQLRKQATRIKPRMDEQRRKARTKGVASAAWKAFGQKRVHPLPQHKLSRLAERIERHISQHRCQE
jgi:hypothetical protein